MIGFQEQAGIYLVQAEVSLLVCVFVFVCVCACVCVCVYVCVCVSVCDVCVGVPTFSIILAFESVANIVFSQQ